ncbi:hypothetical protein V6N11_078805 [Hibiscus sabdariffa]|uniref:AAA+ ATPase domain-containing protein n=1 Tax=Hibiscus sabdariffa TaxID=183260 RepID=A0ABR2RTT0_9ROSI
MKLYKFLKTYLKEFVLLHIIFSRGKMEAIISIVGALAAKAAEYTVDPAARQLSYLFKPRSKFLNLQTKVRDLEEARQRLQQSVEAATRNGEVIFDNVKRWLTEVNGKISGQSATQMREDEEKATKRCLAGFCPNFKSRYHFSKKADKEANDIAQLLIEKDAFNAVGYLPAVRVTDIIRPVKEYEAFGSRSDAFNRVMAALEDDTVSIIGVYGMGGVGKTTLVKEAAKQANEKQLFNEVVLVSIKQKPNMVNVQEEIAEKLGMTMTEKNVDLRAARLRERLKEKRILVVLDDIWESLELEALGISCGDEQKGCKMLMTSRKLDVLESLNSQPNISIETLKENEAWNLFKRMVGLVEGSDFQSIAVEVSKRCAGLPIAIATISKALKPKKDLFEWKDALRQLSQPSERNFKGIPKDAYSAIELSYTFLDAEELRPIFLLCSVMAQDADPEDLLRYAIGLGFLHDLNTMEASRDRLLTLINDLKASCLLLEGSDPNCFDMHDVVRDVAQSIASRDLHWLALFKEWPDEEKMKENQLISLQNAEVSELLHHEIDCPNLTCFSIGMEDYSSLNISKNFFTGMQRLKVLEFSQTHITSLPSSIASLKTLCTLRLRNCGLEDIAILGELGNLEILDLRRSTIKILPKEIGQLTRLKLLDLSDCHDLEVITPNVLSKLSRLEELYLYGSFDKWEVERIENPRNNSTLVELQHLSRLTTLEVHIPDVEAIPKDNLFFGRMERYKISIGDKRWYWYYDSGMETRWDRYYDSGMETSRMLKLRMNKSIHLVDGIKLLFQKTQSLCLGGMEDVEEMQMLDHPNVESFRQLRFMKVNYCNMMKNLFSFSIAKRLCQLEELEVSICKNMTKLIGEMEEADESNILEFNKLRILKLIQLERFNGLWNSEYTGQSLVGLFDKKISCPALEELKVEECHKLKYVFTSSTVKSFVHLKRLEVSNCDEMEGIIEGTLAAEGGVSSSITVFPKLYYLYLSRLPKLKRFGCVINPIEFPSLKTLRIWRCCALNTFTFDDGKNRVTPPHYLFNEEVNFPVLEELEIGGMDNLERLWADQLVEHSFSKLTSVDLRDCPKLLNVFPLSMFSRLDSLSIQLCESIEEIIYEEGGNTSNGMPSLYPQFFQSFDFPNLEFFCLWNLPNLKSIHHNKMHTINWPSLKKLRVYGCEKVEIVFANSGETSSEQQPLFWVNESTFPNLQQLTLGPKVGIKHIIWHCQGQQQQQNFVSPYFPNLKVVELNSYPEQVIVLPPYSLSNLQTLDIWGCSFKEMIFQSEEGGEEKPASLLLSQITQLRLHSLREMMHLWKEKEGFPNLRILHVSGCPKLKANLVPSSVSFRNLVTLTVQRCDGIIKLITHSTAKSLVQLKQMSIEKCRNIEEIVQGDDDDDDDDISFPQLNRLKLVSLPKLESFCSSDKYTFGFPSLQFLLLRKCPKMKMFSQGHSNTPILHKVGINWNRKEDERWEGNLNSTIQKLFREKNLKKEVENSVKDLDCSSTSNSK